MQDRDHVVPSPILRCTQYLLLSAAVIAAGCGPPPTSTSGDSLSELSLQDQAKAVRRGQATRILVEAQPVKDADVPFVAGLDDLTELLLDHSDSQIRSNWFLVRSPRLTHLRYRGAGVDDVELMVIVRNNPQLQILNIPRADFTDSGLESLQQLPSLVQLRFGSRRVTDAGMKSLAEMPALKRLHLIDVPITGAGLAELAKNERLESLYIDGADISDDAWDKIFRERPKLHVHINQQHHDRDPHKHPH
jgi:hypothetical protein